MTNYSEVPIPKSNNLTSPRRGKGGYVATQLLQYKVTNIKLPLWKGS